MIGIGEIISIILAIAICLLLFWGFYKLIRLPAKRAEQERQEQERQLHYRKVEEQYLLEQARKESEKRQEEVRAEEQKRQEEIRIAAQELREKARRQVEEKHAAHCEMTSAIVACPAVVSDTKVAKVPAGFIDDLTFSNITKRTDMEKLGDFVALDTETTGLKYTSDEIIDVAAIRFRAFRPVASFSTLLSASKPIPKQVSTVNHITDELVAGHPCFQQIAESLIDFIGDDNVVGHNLPFDLKFIVHYGADITTRKRKYFDTLALARKTIPKAKRKWDRELEDYIEDYDADGVSDYKLGTLCDYFGILNVDAHRAESDALAAGLLFQKLAELRKG